MSPIVSVVGIAAIALLVLGIARETAALAGRASSRPLGARYALAIALAILLYLSLAVATARSADAATEGQIVRSDVASLVATARGADHLSPIPRSSVLDAIASTRARQITRRFAHDLIPVPGASLWGEVIAWDSYPVRIAGAQAVAMFLGSPEHRRIMLGRWTAYGVGAASRAGRWYVAVVFARWP